MRKRETYFKHKELENKWVLNQVRGLNSSFWLTVPLDADFILIKHILSNLPGGSSEFIIADAFEAKEIYFRCDMCFKKLFFHLMDLLGLTYTGVYSTIKPSMCKKKVNQYTLDGEFLQTWGSIADIHTILGYNQGIISRASRGVYIRQGKPTNIAYGFKWELQN